MNTEETAKQYETTVLYVLFLDTMVEIIVVGVVYQLPPYIRMRGGVRLPAVLETTYAVRPYDQQGCHTNRESPQIQMRQSGVGACFYFAEGTVWFSGVFAFASTLSRSGVAVHIVSKPPVPQQWGPDLPFWVSLLC